MSSELLQSSHKSKLIPGFIPPCFFLSLFHFIFFLYINGRDRGSGSTAHPSPVTSSLFVEFTDSLGMELLAAFKLKSKVCLFKASVCYCRLQDCAPTGLTQSFRILLVSWHTKDGWPCLIAKREKVNSLWKRAIRISTGTPTTLLMFSLFSSVPTGSCVDRN